MMNSIWFVFSPRNTPCFSEKCHTAGGFKLFQNHATNSGRFLLSQRNTHPLLLWKMSYRRWSEAQNSAMKSVRFDLFQNFQDLVDFQSRWPLRDYPRFFGDRNITLSLLLSNLSVVTFLARVITFLCSLLDDHFVTFLAVSCYISMQLFYYISMQVLLHFYAGITFLCKVVTFLCRLLHF